MAVFEIASKGFALDPDVATGRVADPPALRFDAQGAADLVGSDVSSVEHRGRDYLGTAEHRNEIGIVNIANLFPLRISKMLKFFRERYDQQLSRQDERC